MLITPRPGAHRDNILQALRDVHSSAMSAQGPGASTAYQRLLNYLEWASDSVRTLRSHVSDADLDQLILTRRHNVLLDGVGHLAGSDQQRLVNGLINQEFAERVEVLDAAAKALQDRINCWRGVGEFVIPDSSFYIHHPTRFDEADYPAILGTMPDEGVHLLLPIVIVDELDNLKETKKDQARYRAGYTLAVLDRILDDHGHGTLHQRDIANPTSLGGIPGAVTAEILFDPPGHTRLPINDDEIIDRAVAIQALAGRHVRILTYDTGQSTRARTAGLLVKKLRTDAGSGDEPDWAAKQAQQQRGAGGRAQRRNRRDAEADPAPEG